jgi:putative ABC transport system permease protein
MTCALFAIMFVKDEMSYDRWHSNASRLYRLTTLITHTNDGTQQLVATTGQVQGPAFKSAIPEIADYVRILGAEGLNLTGNNKSLAVKNIYADSNFFSLFSFPLVSGNAKTALTNPRSIVLSENTALKFFGTTDIVGKTLTIEEARGMENLLITGVAKNSPSNSSIQFDVVVPFSYMQLSFKDDNWLNQYLTTFILLEPGANAKTVEQKLSNVFTTRAKKQFAGSNLHPDQFRFGLAPFTDIHLKPLALSGYGAEDGEKGLSGASNIVYSYILSGIIGFILLMACVNFINLTIAGSLKRTKEIGIRKIIGSSRKSIIIQFLTETALVCCGSYILSIVSIKLLLPVFNELSGKNIALSLSVTASFLVYGAILLIGCIIIAGLYPALVVSSFNPLRSIAGKLKSGGKNYFGKGLIVFQFALAIGLLTASCVYYYQMKFISTRDLGYNPHDIIKIGLPIQRMDSIVVQSFRDALLMAPSVNGVARVEGITMGSVITNGKEVIVRTNSIDENYLPILEIPLKEGRNFYTRNARDSAGSVIVNEAFEKAAGFQHAVGHQLVDPTDHRIRTIIGVVRDYHYASLKEDIRPVVLNFRYTENILVKIQQGKDIQALSAISEAFKRIFPDHYFEYQFLEDENLTAYQADKKWEQIIFYAAGIAMLICCIGLFGLSIFVAQRRIKEIGIRKVLGASVAGITTLLAKDFIKLVILAIAIATPLAWLAMNEWLDNFAYRIHIEWWIFALSAFISIAIALFAISLQSIRAALANPVKSLRAE